MTEKNNIIKSINKNVRSGARKANLVLKFIKGKKADVALRDLEFTRKKVAEDIKKTWIYHQYKSYCGYPSYCNVSQ